MKQYQDIEFKRQEEQLLKPETQQKAEIKPNEVVNQLLNAAVNIPTLPEICKQFNEFATNFSFNCISFGLSERDSVELFEYCMGLFPSLKQYDTPGREYVEFLRADREFQAWRFGIYRHLFLEYMLSKEDEGTEFNFFKSFLSEKYGIKKHYLTSGSGLALLVAAKISIPIPAGLRIQYITNYINEFVKPRYNYTFGGLQVVENNVYVNYLSAEENRIKNVLESEYKIQAKEFRQVINSSGVIQKYKPHEEFFERNLEYYFDEEVMNIANTNNEYMWQIVEVMDKYGRLCYDDIQYLDNSDAAKRQYFVDLMNVWMVNVVLHGTGKKANELMPIFYSQTQGTGKTVFVSALISPFSLINCISTQDVIFNDDKDGARCRARFLVGFDDEVGSLSKADLENIKKIMSRTEDGWVEKYESNQTQLPKIMSFIGTTNVGLILREASRRQAIIPFVETALDSKVTADYVNNLVNNELIYKAWAWAVWQAKHNSEYWVAMGQQLSGAIYVNQDAHINDSYLKGIIKENFVIDEKNIMSAGDVAGELVKNGKISQNLMERVPAVLDDVFRNGGRFRTSETIKKDGVKEVKRIHKFKIRYTGGA